MFFAFVLQRKAVFRVCLAFLQLPPFSIAGIINSTLLPRSQVSTFPYLIWNSSQQERWDFPPLPHWPRFKQQHACDSGASGRLVGPLRCHHWPSQRLPSQLSGAIPGALGGPSEHRAETPEDLLSEVPHGFWPPPADRATGCHADPPAPRPPPRPQCTDVSQLDSAASSDHTSPWHGYRGYISLSAFGHPRHNL